METTDQSPSNQGTGQRSHIVLPVVTPGESIPKIIHQTHYTLDLPPELKESIGKLRAMNPDWDYRFYLDADIEKFIRTEYGDEMYAQYCRIDPSYGAGRADFFRYLVMYKVGGVYLDIKSTITRPLSEVLRPDDRYLLAGWHNEPGKQFEGWGQDSYLRGIVPSEYEQWHIIAAPGHPFLRAVIENVLHNIETYRPWVQGVGHKGVYRVTGPVAYTLAIHPLRDKYPHRYERYDDAFSLQYSIYGFYGHHTLFKSHYVRQTKPVVKMTGLNKIFSQIHGAIAWAILSLKIWYRSLAARKANQSQANQIPLP